jgi:hypothetical protein
MRGHHSDAAEHALLGDVRLEQQQLSDPVGEG